MKNYTFKQIAIEQKKPLDCKIKIAVEVIREAYSLKKSRAAIAFSGGKDSTVLMHLIKTHFPQEFAKTAVIFGNTGVEYPESLKFARETGRKWAGDNFYETTPERLKKDGLKYAAQTQVLEYLTKTGQVKNILKPDGKLKSTAALERAAPPEMMERFRAEGLVWEAGTPKSYWWCADQYGFPILGKAASKLKARRINIDCFLEFSGTVSDDPELLRYYEMLRGVKISQACCDILKKEPSERMQAELKVDLMRALYSDRRSELLAEHKRIETAIGTLSDPVERTLLGYKYIDGMTWEEICVKINYSWRQVHRFHGRALKNINMA